MSEALTASPQISFRPEGQIDSSDYRVKYSVLPRELTCTENLTPWLKLLPCKSKSGLASLLNSFKIYDTNYHALGLHMRAFCTDSKSCLNHSVELTHTLELVFDPYRMYKSFEWDLSKLFDRKIDLLCTLSSDTKIYLVTNDKESVLSEPSKWEMLDAETNAALYEGDKLKDSIGLKGMEQPALRKRNSLLVDRYLTGFGQEYGKLVCVFDNSHSAESTSISYFELLPWYIRVYISNAQVKEFSADGSISTFDIASFSEKWLYIPAIDRERPAMVECQFVIPAHSKIVVSFNFERAYLKYTEFPYDPNRGLDISAAVITISHKDDKIITAGGLDWYKVGKKSVIRITTPTLLLTMPLPDFTMPYNVITLTCTAVALFFGSMFNLLYRRFYPASEKVSLKQKIFNFFKKKQQ